MKLSNHELKLITLLAINGPDGAGVAVAALEGFFDRPVFLRQAVASLARWQLVTHDPFKGEARLLVQPVLRALSVRPAGQGVLFPDERPLDAALASASALPEPPALSAPECTGPAPGVAAHSARAGLHAPCVPLHAHVNVTSKRSDVSTIKRNVLVPVLRAAVREFVGDEDYRQHWEHVGFWHCERRCEIMQGTLNYIRCGPATKTTPGRHLWAQFKLDCAAKGIEPIYRVTR